MRQNFNSEELSLLNKVTYLVGDSTKICNMINVPALRPFSDEVLDFLADVSGSILSDAEAKTFPDVITFGFWIRRASLSNLKKMHIKEDGRFRSGRGIVFHIAPSNVPVNYAYSLVSGLLTGNANIVRVPSKDFKQVKIINAAIDSALKIHKGISSYIALVRYERDEKINNLFSAICSTRVVWGGDATINELRKSPLAPRAAEITFADRYSLAVIDSDSYLAIEDKKRIAEKFYNDTYLTDQNACTSPRIVVWVGKNIQAAKALFWSNLYKEIQQKYKLQPICAINKLTSAYMSAVANEVKIEDRDDNTLMRISVKSCSSDIMDYKDNSGFFYEYECSDILDIRDLCDDTKCQTIGYIGDKGMFDGLLLSGIKGVDRVVPIGKTMDFDLIWDGYDLTERLTRIIVVQ